MPTLSYPSRAINWGNPVNQSHPLNRGLVSWWLCGAPWKGATWHDLCGRNPGTLTNMDPATDWIGPLSRPGGTGALDLDGSNDHVRIPVAQSLTSGFTIFGWARGTVAAGGTDAVRCLFSYGSDFGAGVGDNITLVWTHTNSAYAGSFFMIGSGSYPVVKWTAPPAAGTWASVAATWNGTTMAAYVNGISQGTASNSTFGAISAANACFSQRGNNSQYFASSMDDWCIYSRALSDSEIWARHVNSRQGYPGTLNRVTSTRRLFGSAGGGAPATGDPLLLFT